MKPESLSVFERWGERTLLELDEAKREGKKVAGVYCAYAPEELVRAAGAIPVGLCGKKQEPIADAEKILPANLCPLIKSSFGYAITDTCPFWAASDVIIGETTCDGKKKMFEIMAGLKPFFLMHLPYAQTDDHSRNLWTGEIMRLGKFLEACTGTEITEAALSREIALHNRVRAQLKKIVSFNAEFPFVLSGSDTLLVMENRNFSVDLETYLHALESLMTDLERMKAENISVCGPDAPRILLTGCPVGRGSDKVIRLIEACGGMVVCQEHCGGIKSFDLQADEGDDPFRALADRYLRTPCSCMTPNRGRFDLLGRLIREFRAQAVVDMTWQCCHTYNVEAHLVTKFANEEHSIPCLHLETDYSASDTEQLRVRIEAFLEMVSANG